MVVLNGSWSYMPSFAEFVLMVIITMLVEFVFVALFVKYIEGAKYFYLKIFGVVLFANFISGLMGFWLVYF